MFLSTLRIVSKCLQKQENKKNQKIKNKKLELKLGLQIIFKFELGFVIHNHVPFDTKSSFRVLTKIRKQKKPKNKK
jgi:hypothetical protein